MMMKWGENIEKHTELKDFENNKTKSLNFV